MKLDLCSILKTCLQHGMVASNIRNLDQYTELQDALLVEWKLVFVYTMLIHSKRRRGKV